MATEVPTTSDVKNSISDGAVPGVALGLGQSVGRGLFGPGLGTAAGGVAAASTQSGEARMVMSVMAFERAASELMSGGGRSGRRGQSGVK